MITKNDKKGILENRFRVIRRSPKHPAVDDRGNGGFYVQSGLVIVMLVLIIFTFVSPRREQKQIAYVMPDIVMNIEQIPETRGRRRVPPPPTKPAVPVESEIEEIFDEIEFEIENLGDLSNLPEIPGPPGGIRVLSDIPRPIYERFPEYPDSERKKGREGIIEVRILISEKGIVSKVEVISNTTRSKILERAAVDAAYKTRYKPIFDERNRPIAALTVRRYSFGVK